jgi:hypothetical protein
VQPAAGVGQVVAAAIEVAELVRGHPRLADFAGRIAEGESVSSRAQAWSVSVSGAWRSSRRIR